jgi:RNA polymerase sigma-70 factor (ECF subfamily)
MGEHRSAREEYNSTGEMGHLPSSFERFFEAERDRLYGYLALITGNRHEAEEIAQDAFLAVWERWDRVHLLEDPTGYLHRTAINLFRKRYRRAQVLRRASALLPRSGDAEASDAHLLLSEALAALTPRQRAALVLTEMLGYSGTEAAQLLGISSGTVAALKHQGRETLHRAEVADD